MPFQDTCNGDSLKLDSTLALSRIVLENWNFNDQIQLQENILELFPNNFFTLSFFNRLLIPK